jgi:uncharacterized membrane protein YphA (DoxX/SURF4 family)
MINYFGKRAPQTQLVWIALLRIVLGLMFLTTWISNVQKGFYTSEGLLNFFTHVFPQADNPLTFYAAFINGVILPIRSVFAPFQLIAELVMGLAILFGAFTPIFSLVGIFFLSNTFLATFGADWPWAYLVPMSILMVSFFTHAGRVIGIDTYLVKRFGERGRFLW